MKRHHPRRIRPASRPDLTRLVLSVTLVAMAATLLTAQVAEATFPGRNGDIVFARPDQQGHLQVWSASSDLTNQRQLTHGNFNSGFAQWSPDGQTIAFDSDRYDPDPTDEDLVEDVLTMRPDGTHVTRVTNFKGFSGETSWSPDGSLIVWDTDFGDFPARQGVYISRPDGTHIRRVTTLPPGGEFDAAPRFSPDGRHLVFTRYMFVGDGEESALFIVGVDGSHERRIEATATLHPGDADWSPDGRTLVFEADGRAVGSRGDIYTIRPNGTRLRNLTNNPTGLRGGADPIYSPDGRKIMFVIGAFPSDGKATIGLAAMRANGDNPAFISDHPKREDQPDWESVSRSR